jgi:mono/diheme cytochrome c family protein
MTYTLRITPLALLLAVAGLPGCSGDADPGTRVWRKKCAACHGSDGRGRTRFAEGRPYADLTDGRWRHGPDRAAVLRLVADGDPASTMPPFRGRLSGAELEAVVDHVLRVAAAGRATGTP